MLDLKLIKNNFAYVQKKLLAKQVAPELIKKFQTTYHQFQQLKVKVDEIQAERNSLSKQISIAYSQNKQTFAINLTKQMQLIKEQLNQLHEQLKLAETNFLNTAALIPNLPADDVPLGASEADNQLIYQNGKLPQFNFAPLNHWDLATNLNLVDFAAGAKISGTRFVVYTNLGAKLYHALVQFTLDHQTKVNGYTQYLLPVIVNESALFNTAQLPKFAEDLFSTNYEKWLSSTSECQLVNLYANKIIDTQQLPLKLTTNSLCFRKESGAAGKDTRGLIRLHQFQKTELVIICAADDSWKQLNNLTDDAASILKALNLPYQKIELCTGDLGFAAAKTYDLEVWLPGSNKYREISSCSNTLDFQARRGLIRHREANNKTQYVHCLNGTGVAIDRLFAAVLENYQQADGSIKIPEKLVPYFDNITVIKNPHQN